MQNSLQKSAKNKAPNHPSAQKRTVSGAAAADYNPITEGVIWKQILYFFFPMLLSSFFQQLYNTADAVIVGRAAGKQALSAVGGSAGSVLGVFMMFYVGFAGGAAVLTAHYFGAKKDAPLRASVKNSLLISAMLGLTGTLVCFCFSGPILRVMHTPADVLPASLWYLRIVSLGMIPNALYNMGSSVLRATGDVRRPLAILIFTCACNIGLDLLLVAGLQMGATGAALATIVCQMLSSLLVLFCLQRTGLAGRKAAPAMTSAQASAAPSFEASAVSSNASSAASSVESASGASAGREDAAPLPAKTAAVVSSPREMAVRILRMGLPLGFTEVMYTFANVILMAAVNSFGTDTVAAYAAYTKIDAIFWMIVGSFGIAITTFVGQNIGAGKWDRVMQSIRDCALMMFIALGIVIFILYFYAAALQGLFCTDPEVITIGAKMMHFLMPFYFLYIPTEILFGALRGMGNAFGPTLLTFFGVCVLRSFWGLFIVPLHHTVNTVLLGFPVTWIVTSVSFTVYFLRYIRHYRGEIHL